MATPNGDTRSEGCMEAAKDYIASRISITDQGCWNWNLSINNRGYGIFFRAYESGLAHRYSYESHIGPIPDHLQIDHLCRNKACVNPSHLEPVTPEENQRRAREAAGGRKPTVYQLKDGRWAVVIEVGKGSARRRKSFRSVSRGVAVGRMSAWLKDNQQVLAA